VLGNEVVVPLKRVRALLGTFCGVLQLKGENNEMFGATYQGPPRQKSRKCAVVVVRRPERVVVGCLAIIFPTDRLYCGGWQLSESSYILAIIP
jgi:hypothetical protein